jgi:hypothetical protein
MPKDHIKNSYSFTVKPEHPRRPINLKFLERIERVLNMTAIARELPSCPHPNTLVSRLKRRSTLGSTVNQRAFAHEAMELFNEMFWELGVGLGHFPEDPHKKYRYFYLDESERIKDKLSEMEKIDT